MIEPHILISIEKFSDTLQFHGISDKGPNNRATLQARLISKKDEVNMLLDAIIHNKFDILVTYFQLNYNWYHTKLNFSYGTMLRNYIIERRQTNENRFKDY